MSEEHSNPLVHAWVEAEQAAMADLGFHPLRDEVYAMPLDDAGEWEARVVLPKHDRWSQAGAEHRWMRTAEQEMPQAGVVHRPTEQLIRELKRYEPGEGVDAMTVGTAGHGDLPTAGYPALTRLRVTEPDEIPAAVAETVRTVREVHLPLVRGWMDIDRLVEVFDGPPPGPSARRFWLERRAVLRHLRGDNAGASAALDELALITGDTGIAALDVPDGSFADGMRVRLGRPTRMEAAEQTLAQQVAASHALVDTLGELRGQATDDDNHIHAVVAVSGDVLRLELDPQVMGMTAQALAERIMAVLAAARADALRQVEDTMGTMFPPGPSWKELASGAPVDMAAPLPPLPDLGR